MKITGLYLIMLIIGCFVKANAQTAEDSVKQTINSLFDAMRKSSPAEVEKCFADSAILQTILVGKDGRVHVKTAGLVNFVQSISTLPENAADERIIFETIRIDGNLAIAWTPYSFYFREKFSHCGVNSFQLVRLNGNWKIQYLIDTRRKSDCKE